MSLDLGAIGGVIQQILPLVVQIAILALVMSLIFQFLVPTLTGIAK